MTEVFTRIDQIPPEWLTQCLRDKGVLPQGRVVALTGQQEESILSVVGRITVTYSDDAPAAAPRSLFLKTGTDDDVHNDDWAGEVDFYLRLASANPSITVPCYHAAYAPDPARFDVLLDDYTTTHMRIRWPLPPTADQYTQIITCLADLHSRWWNDRRLGREIRPRFTETSLAGWQPVWEQQLAHFFDALGDRLLTRRRKLYEWALPRLLTRLLQRRESGLHYTIAHQDAHPYNFLLPNDPASQTTRLVDWATWDVELGARDLAYLIALHGFPEQRQAIEEPLLRQYHERLLAGGVCDYGWGQLWDDYRLFVAWNLFVPVEQCFWNIPASIWWPHAERSVLAFDDLGCTDLLA